MATKQERREAYAEKLESKRERFADRAAKARSESAAAEQAGRRISDFIPMGQPILVGHHSERRHRRDLERIDRSMRKSIEADQKAAHYASKAESYGTHGVMSDDPDAADKLRAKLARLEELRTKIKEFNAAARKAGTDTVPSYKLTNTGAEIRRLKKRIEQLEREEQIAAQEVEPVAGDGFTLEECPDDNRIRFFFDEKPSEDTRKLLKQNGFRWSPNAGAWQRQLNDNGRSAAQYVARKLAA